MKYLFITIGESSTAKNLLRTSFVEKLQKDLNEEVCIVFVTEKSKREYYQKNFGGRNVLVEGIFINKASFYEKVVAFFARNVFYTTTNALMQRRTYMQGEGFVPPFIKRFMGKTFEFFPGFKKTIRFLELFIRPSRDLALLFDKYRPILVFSTTIINTDIDIPVSREAKRRNIHLVGMVRSWDNLTSYGFLRILPDRFLAQNNFLKKMANKKHGVSEKIITVVGTPHYDQYQDKKMLDTRETYCAGMGIDPNKKIIIYGAVGDYLFPHEGELANIFENLIETKKIVDPVSVVFRAHPAFASPLDRMKNLKHVVPDRGAVYVSGSLDSWQMEEKNIRHLINSIFHSDIVVTSGSTMMLDGVAFNKPVITVGFDGESKSDYWFSVKRFYDHMTHIVALMTTKGITLVERPDELASAINRYIKNPLLYEKERQIIKRDFIEPNDGNSTERLAKAIKVEYDKALEKK